MGGKLCWHFKQRQWQQWKQCWGRGCSYTSCERQWQRGRGCSYTSCGRQWQRGKGCSYTIGSTPHNHYIFPAQSVYHNPHIYSLQPLHIFYNHWMRPFTTTIGPTPPHHWTYSLQLLDIFYNHWIRYFTTIGSVYRNHWIYSTQPLDVRPPPLRQPNKGVMGIRLSIQLTILYVYVWRG